MPKDDLITFNGLDISIHKDTITALKREKIQDLRHSSSLEELISSIAPHIRAPQIFKDHFEILAHVENL